MALAITTPTRGRWQWLVEQAARLGPQMRLDDVWVIVADNDPVPPWVKAIVATHVKHDVIWHHRVREPGQDDAGQVNACRNLAVSLAPTDRFIVELDDHDLLEPNALHRIRVEFDDDADYVFGDFKQQAVIDAADGEGTTVEQWPAVRHEYKAGGFLRREIEAIGPRAIRPILWKKLGGWNPAAWPGGDFDFALRAELAGARIACVPYFLSTVTIDAVDSLSGRYRGQAVAS